MKTKFLIFACLVAGSGYAAPPLILSDYLQSSECISIILLIDPSDRIEDLQQVEQDLAASEQALEMFFQVLEHKRYRRSCDRFRVAAAPQEGMDVSRFMDDLTFDNSRSETPIERKKRMLAKRKRFTKTLRSVYAEAQTSGFPGADIWTWLKDSYTIAHHDAQGRRVQGYLLVLTDGYQYSETAKYRVRNRTTYINAHRYRNKASWRRDFERDDAGFIQIDKNLSHVAVLMVGVAPKIGAMNEREILEMYWHKLFKEMFVQRFAFYTSEGGLAAERQRVLHFFQASTPGG